MKDKIEIIFDKHDGKLVRLDDYNKLKKEIKKAEKGVLFIKHIQKHLDDGDKGLRLYKLPKGEVGCAICGKTVEQIYKDIK
jgi:hypothetical protein